VSGIGLRDATQTDLAVCLGRQNHVVGLNAAAPGIGSNTGMAMRVLVIDDHPLMLEIVRAVLAKAFDGPEVHCATGLEEGLDHAHSAGPPDLAVLDLGLPGCKGIEALSRFREAFPGVRTFVLTANEDPGVARAVKRAGAAGYLLKTSKPAVVQAAFALVAAGEPFFPAEAFASRAPELGLSARQLEVLRRIVKGLPNDRIAKEMGISRNTVKQHAHAVFGKLGVGTRAEAAAAAARLGIK